MKGKNYSPKYYSNSTKSGLVTKFNKPIDTKPKNVNKHSKNNKCV